MTRGPAAIDPSPAAAPAMPVVRVVWAVAPAALMRALGDEDRTPGAAAVELTVDPPGDAVHARAVIDGTPVPLLARVPSSARVVRTDRGVHLRVEGLLELAALECDGALEPLYVRTPFLQELGLEPGSYERPTVRVDPR